MPEESERESRDPEVVAEQAYLDGVYERLDAMRRSAERVAEAFSDVRAGGTHQARLERDIAVETTHRRLAALDIGDSPLAFGRIDRRDGGARLGGGEPAADALGSTSRRASPAGGRPLGWAPAPAPAGEKRGPRAFEAPALARDRRTRVGPLLEPGASGNAGWNLRRHGEHLG